MSERTENQFMPFEVKDCALITRMAGLGTAINLRELRERVADMPVDCLFHHFCETQVRPAFDDPEFSNDFAVWSARSLRDRVLAERLGVINPYTYCDLEVIRELVLEILDERISELAHFPSVQRGEEFLFMSATTVVFSTGILLSSPDDFFRQLPHISHSSIYYHFVEARRRTEHAGDDFSTWLTEYGSMFQDVVDTLSRIDFYYLSLPLLHDTIIREVGGIAVKVGHE